MPLPTVAQNAPYAWMIQGASNVGLPTIAQGAPYVWVIPSDNNGIYAPTIVSVNGLNPSNTAAQNDAAIASAIASLPANGPGILLIPMIGSGIYQISNTIIIDRDNVTLLGFGNRLGAPTFQGNTDNPYMLVVGNTKNVNNVFIQGLNFQGLNSTTSTGGGINFRCIGGKIEQVRVVNFGGTGINVASFSATIFEVFLENITLIQNGMNSTTPGDNLVIAASATDFEAIRIISLGNSAKNTTRHCMNCAGGPGKFVACHPYFANQNGLNITGNGQISVIGGEYETNGGTGIVISANKVLINGVLCFGNTGNDINTSNNCSIVNSAFYSTNNGIYANFASGQIADNVFVGQGSLPINLDVSTTLMSVHDNYIQNGAIQVGGTSNKIHDNFVVAAGITEVTGANNNEIHDNRIGAGTITVIGAATKVRNNPGFNPQGAANIVVGASPFTYTAGPTPEEVYITGGTVNPIVKNGITLFTASPATVHLEPGEAVVVTYTVIPTMNKDRH